MSIYVYGLIVKRSKLMTWKCKDRLEARIVMSNIARSELVVNFDVFDVSYSIEQPWLKKHYDIKEKQFLTYENNTSYYFPFKGEGRI